jgi:hypothetical protein
MSVQLAQSLRATSILLILMYAQSAEHALMYVPTKLSAFHKHIQRTRQAGESDDFARFFCFLRIKTLKTLRSLGWKSLKMLKNTNARKNNYDL